MIDEDGAILKVVRNERGQYSIWPAGRDCPVGWTPCGVRGTRVECLDRIRIVTRQLVKDNAPITDPLRTPK